MPIDTKDPFKPQQPAIPGVPREDTNREKAASPPPSAAQKPGPPAPVPSRTAPADDRGGRMVAITICLAGCLVVAGGVVAWKLHQPAQAAVISSSVRPETELAGPSRPPS
ncbi:MAG TPA: hypothetical protein VJS43_13860, partial [Candidatus Acidoferrales bacterium]|nr:hypothetical protein [Candidatus Acidoferrales bacterium]